MKVLYFIVCLLLVACSGDNQPEVNQPFELKNIIVGDQQNQQTFENVAPNVAIVLEFSDAVDEASARNNIALKHEELPVSCDYEFLQEKKVSVTPKGGFKVLSSYKLIVNPGVKSTSGISIEKYIMPDSVVTVDNGAFAGRIWQDLTI